MCSASTCLVSRHRMEAMQPDGGLDSMRSCTTGMTTLYSGNSLLPASGPAGSSTYANVVLIDPTSSGRATGSLNALPLVAASGAVACPAPGGGIGISYRTLQTSRAGAPYGGGVVVGGGGGVGVPVSLVQMGGSMVPVPLEYGYLQQQLPPASLAYSPSLPLPNALHMHPQPQLNCFRPIATRMPTATTTTTTRKSKSYAHVYSLLFSQLV